MKGKSEKGRKRGWGGWKKSIEADGTDGGVVKERGVGR
jgi:hypothetical protein